jgi:hypothetical protein
MIDHNKTHIILFIYGDRMKIIPYTLDAKVARFLPYNLNDVLHILKELEYALPIIPHLEAYYFIYRLQMCFGRICSTNVQCPYPS